MVVGLTGGVATGKSLVAEELKRLGAELIDADAVSREITVKGSPAYDDILKEFGPGIMAADGSIDRKALGRIVFRDPEKLARLNALTHPRIIERIKREIESLKKKPGNPIIVINAALLIEVGHYKEMDRVVVVSAPEDLQVERLALRDGLDRDSALRIIKAQMPIEKKAALADYVIENSGTVAEAIERTGELYERLKGRGPAAPGRPS
jgi:dephospho-CoA kinase